MQSYVNSELVSSTGGIPSNYGFGSSASASSSSASSEKEPEAIYGDDYLNPFQKTLINDAVDRENAKLAYSNQEALETLTLEEYKELISTYMNSAASFNAHESELSRSFNASEAEKARAFNHDEANINRAFNHDEAELNRIFQREMSNTAYQRAAADMKAAGLNPYLVYSQGGAAVTNGSAAVGTAATGPAASSSAASIGTPSIDVSAWTASQKEQLSLSKINAAASLATSLFKLFSTFFVRA